MIRAGRSAELRIRVARIATGPRNLAAAAMMLACVVGAEYALAQSAPQAPQLHGALSFLFEEMSHVLVGVMAAIGGVLAHRAWSRRRWRRAPAATVTEAVLAVDLVDSTQLATRYGESLAMRARNLLERRALAAAEPRGVIFVENTGDGCMMTFPSVGSAVQAAARLLRGLHERPPEMAPGPPLEVRAAVAYGEILIDARGARHGATISKAFRLMSVRGDAFVTVEGEERLPEIPDRNRVLLDEDAAKELASADGSIRQMGVCRLKGFSGISSRIRAALERGMISRTRNLVGASVFMALAAWASAAPLLFHGHGHGLSFSTDGKTLLAPSDRGLAVYEENAWWEAAGPAGGYSGFSVSERAIYSSGHAYTQTPAHVAAGLLRSTDGGRTWQPVALAGAVDFPLLAAGYLSGVIYVLNAHTSPAMPAIGLYLTRDEGKTWRRAAGRGLDGEIHGLAAHPQNAGVLAAATDRGLYLSRDAGESFRALERKGAVTAVAFDFDGKRLRYARALEHEIVEATMDGRRASALRLPALKNDYVTCLAQNPKDERVLAFATRRRDIYLSGDGGATWRRIAEEGAARAPDRSENHERR